MHQESNPWVRILLSMVKLLRREPGSDTNCWNFKITWGAWINTRYFLTFFNISITSYAYDNKCKDIIHNTPRVLHGNPKWENPTKFFSYIKQDYIHFIYQHQLEGWYNPWCYRHWLEERNNSLSLHHPHTLIFYQSSLFNTSSNLEWFPYLAPPFPPKLTHLCHAQKLILLFIVMNGDF